MIEPLLTGLIWIQHCPQSAHAIHVCKLPSVLGAGATQVKAWQSSDLYYLLVKHDCLTLILRYYCSFNLHFREKEDWCLELLYIMCHLVFILKNIGWCVQTADQWVRPCVLPCVHACVSVLQKVFLIFFGFTHQHNGIEMKQNVLQLQTLSCNLLAFGWTVKVLQQFVYVPSNF